MGLTTNTGAGHSKALMSVSKVVSRQVLLQQGTLAMWLWDTGCTVSSGEGVQGNTASVKFCGLESRAYAGPTTTGDVYQRLCILHLYHL